jgi:dihydrofolate synthase/folylpolyglutamate synthase
MERLSDGPLTGGREVWIDGGHNPAASRALAALVRRRFADGKPLHLLFASLSSKDPAGMLKPFADQIARVHTLPIRDHDCRSPGELAALARSLGFDAAAYETMRAALASIPSGARVLIFGSLYLAGEVLAANGQAPD